MKLMTCNSNKSLSNEIASILNLPLTDATIKKFADEEMFVEINENVRGQDVYVIQSTSKPANDHLIELLICIDALKGHQQTNYCCNTIFWICQTR